jgi:hypothetical protein
MSDGANHGPSSEFAHQLRSRRIEYLASRAAAVHVVGYVYVEHHAATAARFVPPRRVLLLLIL